jgi:hypothetical protein
MIIFINSKRLLASMNDYFNQLTQIKEFMKTQKAVSMPNGFPTNHCDHASRLVRELIGLEVITGKIKIKGVEYSHTCNYDQEEFYAGCYVDLTRQQFGLSHPEIVIEKKGNSIFTPFPESLSIVLNRHELLKPSIEKLVREYRRIYA